MLDQIKTLDTIQQAIDDVRRAAPVSPAGRTQMADALGYLYMAEEALRKALREDGLRVQA